ncbi:MAG: hypothetical protein U1A77_10345 [Pirellulales bacterium]
MSTKASVWIDHRKAVVVLVAGEDEAVTTIESGVLPPSRVNSPEHRLTAYSATDKLQRAEMGKLNKFYDQVLACIRKAEVIRICGPGNAKVELKNRVKSKTMLARIEELEGADKMTERKFVIKVREMFSENGEPNGRRKPTTRPKLASTRRAATAGKTKALKSELGARPRRK